MRRIGRQLVVKPADRAAHRGDKGTRDPVRDAGFQLVEMRRLELLTLYMRSKSRVKPKSPAKSRNSRTSLLRQSLPGLFFVR
jgi:hypothetical protein